MCGLLSGDWFVRTTFLLEGYDRVQHTEPSPRAATNQSACLLTLGNSLIPYVPQHYASFKTIHNRFQSSHGDFKRIA